MKANRSIVSLIAVVLATILMFSLFAITVSAEDVDSSGTVSSSGTSTEVSSDGAASESETTVSSSGTTGTEDDQDKKDQTLSMIISLSIVGVVLIIIVIICLIKREVVGKFFRSTKSEFKKIVWLPWNQTRKNTVVVVVVVVLLAVVIGLLDFAFSKGIIALGDML